MISTLRFNIFVMLIITLLPLIGCVTMQNRWEEAEAVNTIPAYKEYLKEYPTGEYADIADSKIENLFFEQAKNRNTIDAYEKFLHQFPNSKFVSEAKSKIEEIKEEIETLQIEKAKQENTIIAYKNFISKFPKSKFVTDAHSRFKELMLNNIKTILVIEDIPSHIKYLPFLETFASVLRSAGLNVVFNNASKHDATLRILADTEALGAKYMQGFRYTGAIIDGKILLETSDGILYETYFGGRVSPAHKVEVENFSQYKSSDEAPFNAAFYDISFPSLIVEMVENLWGSTLLANISKYYVNPENSSNYMVTEEILEKVGSIEPLNTLKNENWEIRLSSVDALSESKDPKAVEPLISALKDNKDIVRSRAAKALGKIKDPRAVEPLISALKDDNDCSVRSNAAQALVKIKDRRALEPLISALKDECFTLRSYAAIALAEIKDPRAVEPLISALKDNDGSVRSSAAGALGKIKDRRAVEPLTSALKDEYSSVRRRAADALRKIRDLQ